MGEVCLRLGACKCPNQRLEERNLGMDMTNVPGSGFRHRWESDETRLGGSSKDDGPKATRNTVQNESKKPPETEKKRLEVSKASSLLVACGKLQKPPLGTAKYYADLDRPPWELSPLAPDEKKGGRDRVLEHLQTIYGYILYMDKHGTSTGYLP